MRRNAVFSLVKLRSTCGFSDMQVLSPHALAVAVCDHHEIALAGLISTITAHGFTLHGSAMDGESGLSVAATSNGCIVLVEMALPPSPGAAAAVIEEVAASGGIPIGMGTSAAPEAMFSALRAGAIGYLTKDMPIRAWGEAILAASRGEALLSRTMTGLLIAEYRHQMRSAPAAQLLPSDRRLTRREWQVLELVADGKSNQRVARDLSISVDTVRTHVSHILAKLDTPNRSAAAARFQHLRAAR
jgi:DNA-binding NarL/FixJ family response regulator